MSHNFFIWKSSLFFRRDSSEVRCQEWDLFACGTADHGAAGHAAAERGGGSTTRRVSSEVRPNQCNPLACGAANHAANVRTQRHSTICHDRLGLSGQRLTVCRLHRFAVGWQRLGATRWHIWKCRILRRQRIRWVIDLNGIYSQWLVMNIKKSFTNIFFGCKTISRSDRTIFTILSQTIPTFLSQSAHFAEVCFIWMWFIFYLQLKL